MKTTAKNQKKRISSKVVLEGQQVLPKETLELGFQYQYSTIKSALTNIVPNV